MSVLSKINWKRVLRQSLATFLACNLFLAGCAGASQGKSDRAQKVSLPTAAPRLPQRAGAVTEVSPPETLQALNQVLDRYQPQVKILSPKPGAVIESDQVSVELQVKDLPIFKDAKLNLGSHVDVVLDNQSSRSVYDLSAPLVFKDLEPGTHTLRVFASRPWHESFKNEGAYAQVTFHLFTPSNQNNPSSNLPLLTYNAPSGSYGAEPILLDFYLSNAPLKLDTDLSSGKASPGQDWQIRCTINGQSFVLDRWQPLYLTGFHPGQNWVRLELIDAQGQAIDNLFNDTVQVIDYQPNGQDTLSKLVRGDLTLAKAKAMILPGFKAVEMPEPEIEPAPSESITPPVTPPSPSPTPSTPELESTPTPKPATRRVKRSVTPAATPTSTPAPSDASDISKPEESAPVSPPEVTPAPAATAESPTPPPETTASPAPEQRGWGRFFSRKAKPTPQNTPTPPAEAAESDATLPSQPENIPAAAPDVAPPVEAPDSSAVSTPAATAEPTITASPESEDVPAAMFKDRSESIATPSNNPVRGWAKFFSRKPAPSPAPTVELKTPETPTPDASPAPSPVADTFPTLTTVPTPAPEVAPTPPAPVSDSVSPDVAPAKSWTGFKRLVRRKPAAAPTPTPAESAATPDSSANSSLDADQIPATVSD